MNIIGIIPARFASQRFPGKPLIMIAGKPMIQWVYENTARCADLSRVIVATDNDSIARAVEDFGGTYVLTNANHPSGTDRCAEAALHYTDADAIINIQGDEPRIHPEQISEVAALLKNGALIASLARVSSSMEDYLNPNVVKVTIDGNSRAILFTREADQAHLPKTFYHHVGIYGFRADILQQITRLTPSHMELKERLEQWRWLENSYSIQIGLTTFESISIDTPEDLKKLGDLIA